MTVLIQKELVDLAQQENNQYIISLDQSTQVTGYAIYLNNQLIDFGHVSFNDDNYILRISKLRDWLEQLVVKYNPKKVIIEDIQLQEQGKTTVKNAGLQTYKKLAHVQGALLTLLEKLKIPYEIILSSSWKSTCGVKGKNRSEQKKNAQLFVLNNFNIKATQDESDAICLGYHAIIKDDFDWS